MKQHGDHPLRPETLAIHAGMQAERAQISCERFSRARRRNALNGFEFGHDSPKRLMRDE